MSQVQESVSTGRIIGIRHQEKMTAEGEVRPTQLYIIQVDGFQNTIKFPDFEQEIQWVAGMFPTGWRDVEPKDDINDHLALAKFVLEADITDQAGADKLATMYHPSQIKTEGGKNGGKLKVYRAREVPTGYDGVRADDIYASMMGGSGGMLCAGISEKIDNLSGNTGAGGVYQIPPVKIADMYGKGRDKNLDSQRLVDLFKEKPELFYKMLKADRNIALVQVSYGLFKAAQDARKAHANRVRKLAKQKAYMTPELYIGAAYKSEILKYVTADEDMQDLVGDEKSAVRGLEAAVEQTDVWEKIFSKVDGVGPSIGGGLIAAIGRIERFHTPAQLATYCGVGITKDAKGRPSIQRRRSGQVSGWNATARGALWNFATYCCKQKGIVWGAHLLDIKAKLQEAHPEGEPVLDADGNPELNDKGEVKKRYTKGHIHKIAIWKLQTDFIYWLWREWGRMVKYGAPKDFRPPGQRGTDQNLDNLPDATSVTTEAASARVEVPVT